MSMVAHMAARVPPDVWHIPLAEWRMSLRDATNSLHASGDMQDQIPLIVQLVENPKYRLPLLHLFHGAVDLEAHDCIHVLLGRGMLPKDEAFVIGFTMGSTKDVGATEETLYRWIASSFYPGVYRFAPDDLAVFRDGLRLGQISDCLPLDAVDYGRLLDLSLGEVRDRLGIETDLLAAYYAIEKRRFPTSAESQRLLDLPHG